MAEKLGFTMQFKPGDIVNMIDMQDPAAGSKGRIESAQEWGAYEVTILEGPRAGETITVAWNYVTPNMAMENATQDFARQLLHEAVVDAHRQRQARKGVHLEEVRASG